MKKTEVSEQSASFIKAYDGYITPKIAIVLGSGLDQFAREIDCQLTISYSEIPGFPDCSVSGHSGKLLLGKFAGVPVVCLQGRAHYYEGKTHADILTYIRTLKLLGCELVILTNAAASLRKTVQPGSLVVIEDHINFQFQNPLVGSNDESFGPRFPSLQNAYDKDLVALAIETGKMIGIDMTSGVYLATLGPCYETPAEIRAFKQLGADVVGMSTVPEVIVARHCNLKVLALSVITNMACGMSDEFLTHEAVLARAKTAADDLSRLLIHIIKNL